MDTENSAQEIDLQHYWWLTAANWRIWASAGIIAALVAGIWAACIAHTQYPARAKILATGQLPMQLGQMETIAESLPVQVMPSVQTEARLCQQILETGVVQRRVVKDCNLQRGWASNTQQKAVQQLAGRTIISVEQPNVLVLEVSVPGRQWVRVALSPDGEAGELAARVVRSYISALRTELSELQVTAAKRKRRFLEEQKQQVEATLARAEERLQRWQAEHAVLDLDSIARLSSEGLIKLEKQREQAKVALASARQRASALREELKQHPKSETASVVQRTNPLIEQLHGRLVTLETELAVASQAGEKTARHPDVRRLQQELEATRESLTEQQRRAMITASATETINPVARRLREELVLQEVAAVADEARIEGLTEAIQRSEEQISRLSEDVLVYSRLVQQVKVKQKLFEMLTTEYEEALVEEQAKEPSFYVIDEPVVPDGPTGPRVLIDMAMAGVIGGLLGWVWVMGWGRVPLSEDKGQW